MSAGKARRLVGPPHRARLRRLRLRSQGVRPWLVIGVIVWAVLSALTDVRQALVEDMTDTERAARSLVPIGPTISVIGAVLGRRWWTLVGLVAAAAVQVLDVLALDRARESSVRAVLMVTVVIVAGTAAYRADRRIVALAGAVYVGAKSIYLAAVPAETSPFLSIELPFVVALIGVGWLIGNTVRRRQAAEERVLELAEQAQLARERERQLLARELHDVVAHELTIIAMQSTLMRMTADPDDIAAARGVIEETSRRALDELKRLLSVLRTSEVLPEAVAAHQASVASVVDAVADQLRALGHEVTVTCQVGDMPRSVELATDRVLRESATNVAKHAPHGSRVWLEVTEDGEALLIVVANDDVGRRPLGPISSTHLGLSGLAERLSLLGGVFSAGRVGDRWVVRSRIPYRPAADPAEVVDSAKPAG